MYLLQGKKKSIYTMGRKPDLLWQYVERLPDQKGFQCNFCKRAFKGGAGATRVKNHLAGRILSLKSGIKSCEKVPQNVKESAKAAIEISKRNRGIGMGKIFLLFFFVPLLLLLFEFDYGQ